MSKSKRTQQPPSKRAARQLAIDRSKTADDPTCLDSDQPYERAQDWLDCARLVLDRHNATNRFAF